MVIFPTFSGGIFSISGEGTDTTDLTMDGINLYVGLHGTYRIYSSNKFSLLGFGGGQYQASTTTSTYSSNGLDSQTDISNTGYSLQAGVQASFRLGSLLLSAFWMTQNISTDSSISSDTSGYIGGNYFYDYSTSETSFSNSSSSIGFDITTRSGWSLSGVSQALTGATSADDSTSIMIQLGWQFNNGKFGGFDSASVAGVKVPVSNPEPVNNYENDDQVYY